MQRYHTANRLSKIPNYKSVNHKNKTTHIPEETTFLLVWSVSKNHYTNEYIPKVYYENVKCYSTNIDDEL